LILPLCKVLSVHPVPCQIDRKLPRGLWMKSQVLAVLVPRLSTTHFRGVSDDLTLVMPNVVTSGPSSVNVSRLYMPPATLKVPQERGMPGAVHRSARFVSSEPSCRLVRFSLVLSFLAHVNDLRLVLQLTRTNRANNGSMRSTTLTPTPSTTSVVQQQSFIGTLEHSRSRSTVITA
jgi:hypothetical protein